MCVRIRLVQGKETIREMIGEVNGPGDLTRLRNEFYKNRPTPWGCSMEIIEKAR
jgi:hypothetical protein